MKERKRKIEGKELGKRVKSKIKEIQLKDTGIINEKCLLDL